MNAQTLEKFYLAQLAVFELARQNFTNLNKAVYRTIPVSGFRLIAQYNPERIRSTAARIDEKTLKERPCFFCPGNIPPQQGFLPYNQDYDIRINPYPIFPRHFTVPSRVHCPQRIEHRFEDMLNLAKDFTGYTIFYNGPRCGASAPDHFHFQMVPQGHMPIENEAAQQRLIATPLHCTIGTLDNYIRKNIILQSAEKTNLRSLFEQVRTLIGKVEPQEPEPMINLLCWYKAPLWTTVIFPRRELRPWQFFAEGEDNILFSPGCVDFGGLLVTPRKEDFNRYQPALLTDLFGQLTLTDESWEKLENLLLIR